MGRPKVTKDVDDDDAAAAARKQLPARSSRGTRIRALVGEEADADASFWGQDAWREDAEDADYSTEEEEEDVVDSDFDERENPDEDVHDAAEDAEKDDGGAARKRGGVYREPMKAAKALLAKKPRVAPPPPPLLPPASRVTGSAAGTPPALPAAAFQYEAPTVRRSTARKSSESSELRKRATEEAARGRRVSDAKAGAAAGPAGSTRLTQAQLLAEAVRTEVANVQSLSRLEQLEEEKKAESLTPKAPFTGRMVRFHSRLGAPKTITFLNAAEFPALFGQPKAKKRERPPQEQQQEENAEDERPEDDGGERERRAVESSEALRAQ